MSLKGFHILLISLSSLLAFVFGGWSARAYTVGGETFHLVSAVVSLLAGIGLIFYVIWFARKVRSREEEDRRRRKLIHPLVTVPILVWLLTPSPASACTVCYGEAEGPMIDAARLGVWLLFGLVLAVQFSFVLFFVYLNRRAKAQARVRTGGVT